LRSKSGGSYVLHALDGRLKVGVHISRVLELDVFASGDLSAARGGERVRLAPRLWLANDDLFSNPFSYRSFWQTSQIIKV
jgi:hypothetical protein